MLISELIAKLENIKNEHGDINTVICDEYGNYDSFDCYINDEFFNESSGKTQTIVVFSV